MSFVRISSFGRIRSDGVVYHAVPTVLGVNAERAAAYARAWDHWVGGGEPGDNDFGRIVDCYINER